MFINSQDFILVNRLFLIVHKNKDTKLFFKLTKLLIIYFYTNNFEIKG